MLKNQLPRVSPCPFPPFRCFVKWHGKGSWPLFLFQNFRRFLFFCPEIECFLSLSLSIVWRLFVVTLVFLSSLTEVYKIPLKTKHWIQDVLGLIVIWYSVLFRKLYVPGFCKRSLPVKESYNDLLHEVVLFFFFKFFLIVPTSLDPKVRSYLRFY